MLSRLILILCVAGTIHAVHGQATSEQADKPRKGRPNLPGTFLIDFGLNFPASNDANFSTGVWGSRTFNLYYQHDIRIKQGKISVHPGIGVGLERYKFKNNYTLGWVSGPNGPYDTLRMFPALEGTKKSQLITNFADIIFEIRYSTNPNDPARSFIASIGMKGGYLFDSFTKLKYREEGETKKFKNKQDWNLTQFRYGPLVRLGVGNFSAFGYYSLTDIFQKGKGPDGAEINYLTVGVSLAGF
jgi:hypothetical protein